MHLAQIGLGRKPFGQRADGAGCLQFYFLSSASPTSTFLQTSYRGIDRQYNYAFSAYRDL